MGNQMVNDIQIKPHLLTVYQVSIIIQVHPKTVRNYIAEGKLKGHNPNNYGAKGLRITVESVREYLKKYELDKFNKKEFEKQIEKINEFPPIPQKSIRRQGSGWVKNW